MADIDQSHRDLLIEFAADKYLNNPAGIGNECTHWVYAAQQQHFFASFRYDSGLFTMGNGKATV